MADSSIALKVNALVGQVIENETDGSYAFITANTATTVTGTLKGGTLNAWNSGDTYSISDKYSLFVDSNISMTNTNLVMQQPEAFPYALNRYDRNKIKGGVFQVGRVATWEDATLLNSWINNFGSPVAGAGYSMDATGNVKLRGIVSAGASSTIMTLPGEIRPKEDQFFSTIVGSSGSEQVGRLKVTAATGNVTLDYGYPNNRVVLDSIQYRTG